MIRSVTAFSRLLNGIDGANREAPRIEGGASITAARMVLVINEFIGVYERSSAIRLDNGPEPTTELFTDWAKEHDITPLFIQPGKPDQSVLIERFNKRLPDEVLDANLLNTLSEVWCAVDE